MPFLCIQLSLQLRLVRDIDWVRGLHWSFMRLIYERKTLIKTEDVWWYPLCVRGQGIQFIPRKLYIYRDSDCVRHVPCNNG